MKKMDDKSEPHLAVEVKGLWVIGTELLIIWYVREKQFNPWD